MGHLQWNMEKLRFRLFGREEVTNPSNSLRATVFRLRKLLVAAGVEGDDKFVHIKSGVYRWTSAIPVELDTVLFENAAKEALEVQGEDRCLKLEKACELYQGDFLPLLWETWVAEETAMLRLSKRFRRNLERMTNWKVLFIAVTLVLQRLIVI